MSGALVSMGPETGQGSGVLASLPLLSSPLFCVPSLSQGPSGLPGSTGQKVMGQDFEGWVPGRSANPTDRRREVSKVILGDGVIGPRAGSTPEASQYSCLVQIPARPGEKPQTP